MRPSFSLSLFFFCPFDLSPDPSCVECRSLSSWGRKYGSPRQDQRRMRKRARVARKPQRSFVRSAHPSKYDLSIHSPIGLYVLLRRIPYVSPLVLWNSLLICCRSLFSLLLPALILVVDDASEEISVGHQSCSEASLQTPPRGSPAAVPRIAESEESLGNPPRAGSSPDHL